MNERGKVIKIEELILEMQYLSNIYDIVRIVDPANTRVLHFVDGKLEEAQKDACFSVWEKGERCHNCISNQSCMEMKRVSKFEFRKNQAFYVLSVPYIVMDGDRERRVAMELVNQVTDDFQLHESGSNQTSDLVRAISIQSYQDSLTGTFNRRYFDDKRYLYDNMENFPRRMGFLMVDVNQFKAVNNVYGHIHGDELLAKVGEILRRAFRDTDKVVRIGGDEFIVIVRDCDALFLEQKRIFLKHTISGIRFEWMGERKPSIAVGMSYTDSFTGEKSEIDELFKIADEEMYRDKRAPLPETSEKTILIVDDVEMNRAFLKAELKDKFRLLEASDGEDGVVILKTNHVDLIITDIFMDHMNGYDFMKNVRRNPITKNIPIIAITENELSSQSAAVAAGADIYIDRTTREELLVKSIMQLTGQDHGRRELFNMDFVLDAIPGAVLVCKFKTEPPEIVYCSRGIHNIAGVEAGEFGDIFHKKGLGIIDKSDYQKFIETIHQIIGTKSRGEIIFRSYKKDGTPVWLWMQARYIGEEDGYPILEEIVLDVSNSTDMYESILDEASSLITVIDCENREILYANKSTRELFDDVTNKKCFEIYYQSKTTCKDCCINNQNHDTESKEWIHKGKIYRQIMKRIEWNGRQALLKCMEDITEQKELQKYVEHEKDSLNQMILNVPAGLFVFQMDQNAGISIVEANPSACELMGIDFNKTIGSGVNEVFELTHPDDRKLIAEVIEKMRTPDNVVPYEYRQYNKEKKEYRWLSAMAHSVLGTDGKVYIYISYFEITEQKRAQKLKQDLAIAKYESQAKTQFMSNMSHDMRTPLNGMLGLSYLMQDKTDVEELHEDAKQLISSGRLLLSLINDTLDISKIESGKFKLNMKPVNSAIIFQSILSTVSLYANQQGINLNLDIPNIPKDEWISVITDESRVEQVLINVITNAIKYSNEGGTVDLHMKTLSITEELVTDQYIIEDYGIGMSEEFLPHLFEPFMQEGRKNTERSQGSGLGMSIVKQLIDLLNGEISVESKENVGTKVTILMRYPVYNGKLVNNKVVEENIENLEGMHILLCEDHPLNRQIVIQLLKKKGIIVDAAQNGKEGVEKFNASRPGEYHAILMDVRMPVMNGIEAAKAIRSLERKDAKSIPILALTANAYAEDKEETSRAGMNEHLAKPVEPEQLYAMLGKYFKAVE